MISLVFRQTYSALRLLATRAIMIRSLTMSNNCLYTQPSGKRAQSESFAQIYILLVRVFTSEGIIGSIKRILWVLYTFRETQPSFRHLEQTDRHTVLLHISYHLGENS